MKNFALIGAGGYIAPRHMKAIKDTGNDLVVTIDKHDSVGIIDSYFPNADFFTEYERFDRHIEKLKRETPQKAIDYISICSPNYLHDSHIRTSLRAGCDAICEKPLVLNPWNIDALMQNEKETGKKIYNILQLRLHESIMAFKQEVDNAPADKVHDFDLTYITSRGSWYLYSWKGQLEKSGGIATNIGVHFFDMLGWIFGEVKRNDLHYQDMQKAGGYLEFEKARVRWFLSIDGNDVPEEQKAQGKRTYRSLRYDGKEIEFSSGFENLHTRVYEDILAGKGFGLEDARKAVEIVYKIRNGEQLGKKGDYHPFLDRIL